MFKKVLTIVVAFFVVILICSACYSASVTKESINSKNWKQLKQFLSTHTKSKTIKIRQLIGKDGWFIVEYESHDFEPVISVIKKTSTGFSEKSGWGGMPEEGDSITDYLAEHSKGVPSDLLKSFKPIGQPFADIK